MDNTTSRRKPRTGCLVAIAVVAALIVGAVGLAIFLHAAQAGFGGRLADWLTARRISVDSLVPAVVEKIQSLNRLETVSYSLDTVVEGTSKTPVPLPDVLFGDKILMIVHGQAIAGVDMAKLRAQDVTVGTTGDGKRSIHVKLPAAEVFSNALDEAHTKVYSRTTGWLVNPDKDLETATREKAAQQLQQAALDDGILDAARKNAIANITVLLSGLGFEQVTVE